MKKSGFFRVWVWVLIAFILGAISLLLIVVNPLLNQFLYKKLNSTINEKYVLSSQWVSADIFKGNLSVQRLKLVQAEVKNSGDTLKVLDVDVEQIDIKNVRIISFLLSGSIKCDSIAIVNPTLLIYPQPKDTIGKDRLGKKLGSIKLKNFTVIGGTLHRFELQAEKPTIDVNNISFELKDFILPKDSIPNLRTIRFTSIEMASSTVKFAKKNGLYAFSLDSLFLSTANEFGYLRGFKLIPQHSKYRFAHVVGRETTRISCNLSEVTLKRIKLNSLLVSDSLLIENILVNGFLLDLFKDKRVARPDNMPEMPLPQELVRGLGFPIKIDTIDFRSGHIAYEGRLPGSANSGTIFISQTNFSVLNTSSIPNIKGDLRDMRVGFNGLLMGQGRMTAQFNLPLANTQNPMTYSGEIHKMDLRKLNAFLQPSVFMRIKSGQLNKLSFNATANKDSAVGKLSINYTGLNVSIQKFNNKELVKDSNLEWLVNMLINSFLIKKDNPLRKRDLRVGTIYFEPDKTRFVVHYWIQSLLSAVPESLGIPPRLREKHMSKKPS
jgi:hypothetical protein